MYNLTVVVASLLLFVSAGDYVRRAWKKETTPVPATWILMMVVMGLSFWMYWDSPRRSWTANVGVTTGLLNIAIMLTGVIAANIKHGTLRVAFDKTQRWCLALGGVVTVFWFITDRPLISYTLVQGIALIAYFATVKKLWRAVGSTEPLFLWCCVLGASLLALYPAWVKDDPFSWIYLARAIPSTTGVVYLIRRAKTKTRPSEVLVKGEV